MLPHTRRTFLKAGTRAATASLTQAPRAGAIDEPNPGKAGAFLLRPFDHGDVELSEGSVPGLTRITPHFLARQRHSVFLTECGRCLK